MARLQVAVGGAEFSFDLRGDAVRVGSGGACGLLLKDPGVGKEHMELRRMGTRWRLVDLESASGTRVNGLFVNKHDLKTGDVIAVGAARLTFQGEDPGAAVPAPIPGVAPVPVPAPLPPAAAPYPGAPAYGYGVPPAPPGYGAPPPAYPYGQPPIPQGMPPPGYPPPGYPPQAYAPPPAPPAARRVPSRGEERERRPSRAPRRSGGGGAVAAAFLFVLIGGLAITAFALLNRDEKKADPNRLLVAKAAELEKKGDWEGLVALDGQGDPSSAESYREVQNAVARARPRHEMLVAERAKKEADDFYRDQIKTPREGNADPSAVVLRCDEFLRRWPDHERAPDVNFIRICLTGEKSPQWSRFVTASELLDAAEVEAGRRVSEGRLAAAYAVYQLFLSKMGQTVRPESQEKFREDMAKKKLYVEQKAQEEFEKLDEKAMILEDRKEYEQVEALYRDARERLGIGEIRTKCDGQLQRLKDLPHR